MWYQTLGVFDRDRSEFTGEKYQLLAPDTITRQKSRTDRVVVTAS
jgi:hypothetical protein